MAETLTYDAGTDTVTEGDALTPEEQQSLEVGEALEQSQAQLLAGKYKDAQELEKAYVELQKKLGEEGDKDSGEAGDTQDNAEVEPQEEATEEEEAPQLSEAAELITSASDEFSEKGELTPETIEKFSAMSSKDVVEAYMQVQGDLNQQNEAADLTDKAITEIKDFAGGEDSYDKMVQWAGQNLDKNYISAFDDIVNSGSVDAIKLAVAGLRSEYQNSNGYEGQMYTGKAPKSTNDVFRSQAELVAAMGDKRYDNDPAYRQDVIEKLQRSDNLEF